MFSNFWPGSGADTNFDITGFVYDNPMQRSSSLLTLHLQMKQPRLRLSLKTCSVSAESGKGAANGSTTTGISAAQLDVSTLDSSNASLPLKIVGILDDVENADFTAAGIPMIVMINNHAASGLILKLHVS